MSKLKVTYLKNIGHLVLRQTDGGFFLNSRDSIIISTSTLLFIINFLVKSGYLDIKTLEGIIEENR